MLLLLLLLLLPSLAFDGGEGGVELGSFEAKYLGSVSVRAAQGNDVCSDAVLRIRVRQQAAYGRKRDLVMPYMPQTVTPSQTRHAADHDTRA